MTKSLFVGNIAYGALESELADHFSQCGSVKEVHFIIDHQRGRFRGFGFVSMPSSDAQKAIDRLNRSPFQGRDLIVREAQSSNQDLKRKAG